ncbi:MAG: glycosyl hydrolase 53 family protein [Alloprevotella sp.]|nr:glycosyl hydrolase 53 family protein [Alloprevotella sp.]
MIMRKLSLLVATVVATSFLHAQDFTLGADISWETEMEAKGYSFANAQGEARECTALMKELGLNAVRLRVWVNPADGHCGKADVLAKAKRAQEAGMDVMIDFHYSDSWADPGKQNIPAAWASHTYQQMLDDVASHTKDVLSFLKENGISVRWVQVGNETSNGLLWTVGQADKNPAQYAGFIDAGYGAVKEVCPEALVIVHLDNGFNNGLYKWNLGILKDNGARFDVVGMSLYPYSAVEWNNLKDTETAVQQCIDNINWVWSTYGVPSMIVETGMKVAKPDEGKQLLTLLLNSARAKTEGHCLGVMYWEPEAPSGYNGGYDMGAFTADAKKVCRPTAIMEAFTEAALSAVRGNTLASQAEVAYDLQGRPLAAGTTACPMQHPGVIVTSGGQKLLTHP